MSNLADMNPAERAANETLNRVYECLDNRRHFLVEAGAGAGKTYSLVKALKHVIERQGKQLRRRSQRVACITYTNIASEEIQSRTDRHPVIHADTIHGFFWSFIKSFQPALREEVPRLPKWEERLDEFGGIGTRAVDYNLGYPVVEDDRVLLHHNDVLLLTIALLEHEKCRLLLASRYPILLIDEYQDTDKAVADSLVRHFVSTSQYSQIGFFGDHWQKIYGTGCGSIHSPALTVIGKEANFRSVPAVVRVLNRMRPDLPQQVTNPNAPGSAKVFHTNQWTGARLTGGHWDGDLPSEASHQYLEVVKSRLATEGWDFATPNMSKILMLTHRVLAAEQGYNQLLEVFTNNDALIKKEDPYIAFFLDTVEPLCTAFQERRYGEMFSLAGGDGPVIRSRADKTKWARDLERLVAIRSTGTVGDMLSCIREVQLRIPNAIEKRERAQTRSSMEDSDGDETIEDSSFVERLERLKAIPYREIVSLSKFIDGHTPFSTKHGVKGAEFENVLVVLGRGWSLYDFNKMLEWAGGAVPPSKKDSFERNRNLFYVACSRPKSRLALLFTQKLSGQALSTLGRWFGTDAIYALQ